MTDFDTLKEFFSSKGLNMVVEEPDSDDPGAMSLQLDAMTDCKRWKSSIKIKFNKDKSFKEIVHSL